MKQLITTQFDLSRLPIELIIAIGAMLSPADLQASSPVSKKWLELFNNDNIWKQKITELHPGITPALLSNLTQNNQTPPHFKNIYFRLKKILQLQKPAYHEDIPLLLACTSQDENYFRTLISQPISDTQQTNLMKIYYFAFCAKKQEMIDFLFNTLQFEISQTVKYAAVRFLSDADTNVLFFNDLIVRAKLDGNLVEAVAENSSLELLWFLFETDSVEYTKSNDHYSLQIKPEFEYDLSIHHFFQRATGWEQSVALEYGGYPDNEILAHNLEMNSDLLKILKSLYAAFMKPLVNQTVVDSLMVKLDKDHDQQFNLYYRFFLKCLHDPALTPETKDYIESKIIQSWNVSDLTSEQKHFMKLLQRIPELPAPKTPR